MHERRTVTPKEQKSKERSLHDEGNKMKNNDFLDCKSRTEWEHIIYEHIFNADDRNILTLRLLDGMTIEKIAERVDLSVSQTKKRLYKAQKKLFKYI